mmetsp:Transcript_34635/g.104560  ORF Transcript_34635/g.104560 Transcript_34635/m.104560 type:complete len:237 (+) Transcript_34635:113-823(+)
MNVGAWGLCQCFLAKELARLKLYVVHPVSQQMRCSARAGLLYTLHDLQTSRETVAAQSWAARDADRTAARAGATSSVRRGGPDASAPTGLYAQRFRSHSRQRPAATGADGGGGRPQAAELHRPRAGRGNFHGPRRHARAHQQGPGACGANGDRRAVQDAGRHRARPAGANVHGLSRRGRRHRQTARAGRADGHGVASQHVDTCRGAAAVGDSVQRLGDSDHRFRPGVADTGIVLEL